MSKGDDNTKKEQAWTIQAAEALLRSLKGVVSVRIVARPGGGVEEIHMLTTHEVSPKLTVRNVESALMAHFGVQIDHRKVSVAQTHARPTVDPEAVLPPSAAEDLAAVAASETRLPFQPQLVRDPEPTMAQSRIVFCAHQVQTERSHQVRMVVTVEWGGERFEGEATGPDLPRARLETMASATLNAIQTAMAEEEIKDTPTLALDGVKAVDAFERRYVLVSVHAISGRNRTSLAGSAVVEDSADVAVIMATLQATDRWVRGRL